MKKTILTLVTGVIILASCKKEDAPSLASVNEYIEFEYNGVPYSYTGIGVGEINEPTTTWYTRIQSAGSASHFELLLNDTIPGTYSHNAGEITIRFAGDMYKPDGNTNILRAIITKYEPVGGIIEGTFEGDVRQYAWDDSTVTGTFTNGKFKVIRDHLHS